MYKASLSILKVITYFNVFNYPVRKEEIISFLDAEYSIQEINEALDYLLEKEIIFQFEDYYSLQNNYAWITRRKEGNEKAIGQLSIAGKVAGLLAKFPYVRGVAVSGSLSKHFADENADIDFFIITAKNRLWVARTIMHLFKKLTFLTGRQHWYCMNYYVDETALEIKEKNIYTATEIVTALPMHGEEVFRDFFSANTWIKNFFPHYVSEKNDCKKISKEIFKTTGEYLLNNKLGDWLDNFFMKITARRWQKKTEQKRINSNGILMGMDAGKHYSKPVPGHLQEKVAIRFNLKMEQLIKELEAIPTASVV